jgi:hypothetical protein
MGRAPRCAPLRRSFDIIRETRASSRRCNELGVAQGAGYANLVMSDHAGHSRMTFPAFPERKISKACT